ncbi:MAG: ParA family protein [Pseudomonadota bacterium]
MAARTLALASLKGGCGKTTLAFNLAAGFARTERVGLLDADPQGTVRHWAEWSPAPALPRIFSGGDDPLLALAEGSRDCQRVVLDCPPTLAPDVTGRILERVDMVLIPILPSPLDLWAGASTVEAVARARQRNPGLKAWLVLNQVEPGSALSRAMAAALAGLEIPTLTSQVRRRAAYRLAAVEGVSVYQLGARGREAAREIDRVIEEIQT